MAAVTLEGVTKRFGAFLALDELTLDIDDGELMVLLGPSGCGKTTALRVVAGLEDPDAGSIAIGHEEVNDVDPRDRDVAMVFQSYALYPHLTVRRNIEFPLRQRDMSRQERAERAAEVAKLLGLDSMLDRKPAQLSGGQRQRVALARAIVRRPQVFLMDEPLSNLDAALRVQTRADIVALQRRLGVTTLYVTHDQVEAMTMGHRIAVMNEGRLQQVAAPQELYAAPANTFVARFLGSPGMNLLEMAVGPGAERASSSTGWLDLSPKLRPSLVHHESDVVLGVRPEDLHLDPQGSLTATVVIVEMLGAEVQIRCRTADDEQLTVRQEAGMPSPQLGQSIALRAEAEAIHVFDRGTGQRLAGPETWGGPPARSEVSGGAPT